ncbi:HNH endonuclease [Massilia glaciei]|uniref:HNH endonuclease n=1 Tax=Massilia glaciei TaxID=1524097 RepID=A0A2U2I6R1_9BURK|nr:HNH endonuclease [Massilia glaciei]PWF55441.1 HNH endonuclease [Massilia glaciei]
MITQILTLDIAGNPFKWISPEDATHYYATDKVAWELGDREFVLRGGVSNAGVLSIIRVKPIIAIARSERMARMMRVELPLGDDNKLLFARDRHTCAYCGNMFGHQHLSRDHVRPRTLGGPDTWMNCVTACRECNQAKGAKPVHEFRPLLYVPYVPCRFEHFILSGRNALADQHDYLSAKLPKHSRLLA